MRWSYFDVTKLDVNSRVKVPRRICDKFGWKTGQLFKIEVDEERKAITYVPIGKTLKIVTADGQEIEVEVD